MPRYRFKTGEYHETPDEEPPMSDEEEVKSLEDAPYEEHEAWVAKDVRVQRYATCLGCDRLFRPTRQCQECGCFMFLKTRLTNARCPLGKW